LVSGLPHVEELWCCYRASKKASGHRIPECDQELYAS
jgi:hypothetical protein